MPRSLDCQQVRERLEAYVDGDLAGSGLPGSGLPGSGLPGSGLPGSGLPGSGLPGLDATAFAAHLETCPSCAAEHSLAVDIRRELRALPEIDTPPQVMREVYSQVGRERFTSPSRPARPRFSVWKPAWAALAAATLAAVLLGGGLMLRKTTPATTGPEIARLDPSGLGEQPVDPQEVDRATEEALLAFAHIARVSRKAGFQVRDDLGEHLVATPALSLTRVLFPANSEADADLGSDLGSETDRS